MSLFAKSGWEALTHEQKEITASRMWEAAFEEAVAQKAVPENLFYQKIMSLLDSSDKPLSKFMSNNAWWLESKVQALETKYNLKRDEMYGDTRPPEEDKTKIDYESDYTTLYILIAVAILFVVGIIIYKRIKS